jgi:GR25 family glycosyltransferase involved in LPS biosynthesis
MFLMVSDDESKNKETTTILQKPGVIGCWLSHKRLLRHLNSLHVSSSFGHLITEDDVDIPADFAERWAALRSRIPSNWDVVYLGAGKPTGSPVANGVLRAVKQEDSGNTGTYAYLVRHGAIPAILTKLEFMSSPIDKQYYKTFTDLNVYVLNPALITPGTFDSSILTMENRSVSV